MKKAFAKKAFLEKIKLLSICILMMIMLGQGGRVVAAAGESLNYSNLKAAIDRATVYILDEEFMDRYTEESTQNFIWVYNRAKEMCDNSSAKSQEEIDDGIRTLEFLQNSLILKVFDVVFECNEGSETVEQKVTYGYLVTEPEAPVREGYIFGGWFIDKYFDEVYDFELPVKKDMILYAKWSVDATRLRQAIEYAENVLADEEALVPYSEDSIATYQEVLELAVELVEEDYLETVEEMEEYIDILTSPKEILELKEFTVSFDSNEGSLVEDQSVLYGSQATEPEAPVRTGYLFARWYIDEGFEEAYNFENEVKQNYMLYAKWDVDYQTLVQAVNEATADLLDKSFLEPFTEESIQNYQDKLDAANKMLSEKNAETAEDVTEMIAALGQGKKELARKPFTITFVSDDGEVLSSQVVLFGDMVKVPEPPSKEDYLFDAWCMDAGLTTLFDFSTAIMMDTTIYARWNVDYAELRQAIADAKDKLDNSEMMAPYTKESIRNYTIVMEKAEKMLTGETANTASDTKAMIEELKAAEEALEVSCFQFVFDSNGGTSLKEQNIYYGDMVMEPEAPTREGYLFKGWFVDEGLTELYNFTTKITADRTVYAKWAVNYAGLEQELKHVEDILGNDVLLASYTQKTVQRLENAYNKAKKVYDSQSALTALEVKNLISEMNNAEKALTVKVFLITFECNEGTEIASQNVEYNNKVIYPEDPVREGYCFDGWYLNDEFTAAFDFTTQIKDDYVLYAKWNLDYSSLETAIAQAREVVDNTVLMDQYADATVFAYMSIIEGATEVLEEQSAESPDEINEIIEALQDAREALTIKTLAVSFNTNGGNPVATKYVTYGNAVNKPSNPSRTGYLFVDWYADKELSQVYDFTAKVKKNITIYAKWDIDYANLEKAIQTAGATLEDQAYLAPYTSESIVAYERIVAEAKAMVANNAATCAEEVSELAALLENPVKTLEKKELTVTFETNGGTLVASQSVTYGESVRKPANPTRTDFIFDGWFTDEGFTKNYVFTSPVKQDTVIYVKWILDYSQLKVVVQDANKKLTNMEFLAPYTSESIKNYENAYHEASSMLEQQTADSVESINDMMNAVRAAEKALTKKTLTVRFATNGGTEVAEQKVIYGEYVAKVEAPAKENYNFAGWFADEACTKAYNFASPVKQDITIHAKWDVDYTKLEEAISYAESKLSNEALMAPYTEQSIDNYRKVLENAKAVCNSQSAETAEDMLRLVDELSEAFKALEVKNYQVSFNSNGGSSVETQTVNYGSCATEPADPTKTGYVFAGWFKQETLQEVYNFTDEVKANVVVYAKWNIDYSALSDQVKVAEEQLKDSTFTAPYTADSLQKYQNILTRAKQVLMEESAISAEEVSLLIQELKAAAGGLGRKALTVKFDTNGGSQVAAQRIGYGDSVSTIETPKRDGYDFTGWYKDQGLSEIFDQSQRIVDNMTIYAGWALNYQELDKTVSAAEEKMMEAEFEAKYSKTSLLAFYSAYDRAKSMLDAQNAETPEDIQTAVIALENAQANLAIKRLTVSFVMNGGSAVEKQIVSYGEKAVQPTEPTKAGFTFNNWYTNKTFTNVYDFAAPVKKNVTIYAKWDVFYGNLEDAIQYAQSVLASEDIVSYTETSVEDYRVVLQEAIEMQANDTAKTAEQVASLIEKLNTPQAILIKRVLEVTFDCNGGTTINAQNITYGDKVSMPTNPSKAGYIFIGWYADSALTDDYSFGAPVTESIVLYAKWELNYNALKDALDVANEKLADPDFIPSETNSTMDAYMEVYNKANDMFTYKKAVSVDDIVRMISELEKAEAQLETRDVTVSFVSNCDTIVDPQTVKYGETVNAPAAPEKEDYVFIGWFTDSALSNAADFTVPVKEDIVLHAKWKVDYSELTALINEADENFADPIFMAMYNEETIGSYQQLVEQARDMVNSDSCRVAEDAKVMAECVRQAKEDLVRSLLVVRFVENDGSIVATQTLSYGETVKQPEKPEKAGYVFIGWFTDETLEQAYDFTEKVIDDKVLYAKWEVEYSVLADAINEANVAITPDMEVQYTKETWGRYKVAYDEAIAMMAEKNATYAEEVTQRAENLRAAVAELRKTEFVITFQNDDGSIVDSQIVSYGDTAVEPSTPVKEGYVFDGWYLCGEKYDFSSTVTDHLQITAGWIVDYTELENAIAAAKSNLDSEEFQIPYTEEAIMSYRAIYEEAVAMNDRRDAQFAEEVKDMVEQLNNFVLKKKEFMVSFVTGEGSFVPDQAVEYGDGIVVSETPVREAYVFDGWYLDEDATQAYDLNTPVISDVVLYAKWILDYAPLQAKVDEIQALMDSGEFDKMYENDRAMNRFNKTFKLAKEFLDEKDEMDEPEDVEYWMEELQDKMDALTVIEVQEEIVNDEATNSETTGEETVNDEATSSQTTGEDTIHE